MWQEAKKKELHERKLVWDLHRDLTRQVNMNERSNKVSFTRGGHAPILFLKAVTIPHFLKCILAIHHLSKKATVHLMKTNLSVLTFRLLVT